MGRESTHLRHDSRLWLRRLPHLPRLFCPLCACSQLCHVPQLPLRRISILLSQIRTNQTRTTNQSPPSCCLLSTYGAGRTWFVARIFSRLARQYANHRLRNRHTRNRHWRFVDP
nr:putative integron gene cassette protein [uncultured bacterium]